MVKTRIKIISSILAFCILFGCTGKLLRYVLTDDMYSYTRVTYHEMYEQDNIDILFVGSSHCYKSFVPEILDKELHQNTFNAGSSAQLLDGSLMLIKEAVRNNDVKHIYLEIFFAFAFDVKENRSEPTSTYIISDYLKPSVDKYAYLLNATNKKHYANSFIVARRNWDKLLDLDYIKYILVRKNTDTYKNYDYAYITGDTEWYAGKGYVANSGIVKDWNYFSTSGYEAIKIDGISDDWRDDLERVIDYCDKNHVPLTLISAPMPNFLIAGVGNYDEYIACVNDIIDGRNVDYYDFNLCREEYFPNTSELFMDVDHLNCYGAEVFSHAFAKLVNGEVKPEEMFYESFEEKLESLPTTVFGVSYMDEESDDGTVSRNCKIISNDAGNLEYEITIEPSEGNAYVLRDYSDDIMFGISPDEKGTCILRYRLIGDNENPYEVKLTLP